MDASLIGLGSTKACLHNYASSFLPQAKIATALNPFSIKRQVRGVSRPFTVKIAQVLSKCGLRKSTGCRRYGETEDI